MSRLKFYRKHITEDMDMVQRSPEERLESISIRKMNVLVDQEINNTVDLISKDLNLLKEK